MTLSRTNYPGPFPMQKADVFFGEEPMYRLLDDLANEGVVGANDFKVSQKAAGANLSVDVATGHAYVLMDTPYGGKRRVYNSVISNSGTPGSPTAPDWASTFTSPDGTNPRIDRVVLTVRDSYVDSGGAYDAVFKVIAGTPSAGATLQNLTGAAAVPANSLLLANILVAAGATTITDAAHIDTLGDGFKKIRPRAFERDAACQITRAATVSLATSGTEQTVTFDQEDYDFDSMWASPNPTAIYARTPGYYDLRAIARFAANSAGTRQVRFLRGDSVEIGRAAVLATATDDTYVPLSVGPVLLGSTATNNVFTTLCMQRSGGALNLTSITVWANLVKAI